MNMKKITAIYFSPNGGTRKYVCALAQQLDKAYHEINLTHPGVRNHSFTFSRDELVIMGSPVYGGRLPEVAGGIFENLKGHGTPAVFLVTYGSSSYGDALMELKDVCEAHGFRGIAAGAFVAPHTLVSTAGAGRPDTDDHAWISTFAHEIRRKLESRDDPAFISVPGHVVYTPARVIPFAPQADKSCTRCGLCAEACPVQAISPESPERTDKDACILCMSCVTQCPSQSRSIPSLRFRMGLNKLENELSRTRRQPEVFF